MPLVHPSSSHPERPVVDELFAATLCAECLMMKTGLPLSTVDAVLADLARHIVMTSGEDHCQACMRATVVYRLG